MAMKSFVNILEINIFEDKYHNISRGRDEICGVPFYNGYCKEKWKVEVWYSLYLLITEEVPDATFIEKYIV